MSGEPVNKKPAILVQAMSICSLRNYFEDGGHRDYTLVAGDFFTMGESPRAGYPRWRGEGNCQRCGHDDDDHGFYDFDNDGDEVWVETPCHKKDGCDGWVDFTPWFSVPAPASPS